jgi:clan AA aspartic protease
MGLIQSMLILSNPKRPEIQPVEVEAIADTGAVYLVIPEIVRAQLQLEESAKREVTLADGSHKLVPYVGPVEIRFKNRNAYVGALVMGEVALLGAIPMEDMDLVLTPLQRKVDVNPAHPNYAHGMAVGALPSTDHATGAS